MNPSPPQYCPICRKLLEAAELAGPHRPFCSLRCRQVDFVRWWEGKYAIVELLDLNDAERRAEPVESAED